MTYRFLVAPPSPPTPKVTDWTKTTADLEWIPPLKDGGSKIMGYYVEYKEEGTETWVKVCLRPDIFILAKHVHILFIDYKKDLPSVPGQRQGS